MNPIVRTIGKHNLTPEMNAIIDRVLLGHSLKGEAFSGTGKSTLLRAVEKYHVGKKGLYICYNKPLEMEARKLFGGQDVEIATSHSFALNSFEMDVRNAFLAKVKTKMNKASFIQHTQHIQAEHPLRAALNIEKKWRIVFSVCEQFVSTASLELSAIHITYKVKAFISEAVKTNAIKKGQEEEACRLIVDLAHHLASEMLSPESDCPATHDCYIKVWQLSEPKLNYDYIMFDEAQDANPVLLNVILNQDCQLIFVGDKFQSIYQFRGGVNAMDLIPYPAYPLSCSFRYGQSVADLSTDILRKLDSSVTVKGLGQHTEIVNGTYTAEDYPLMCICYRNDNLIKILLQSYIDNTPAILTSGKTEQLRDNLQSLLLFKEGNNAQSQYPRHFRYKTYDEVILGEKDSDTQLLIRYIDETEEAGTLLNALNWSLEFNAHNADILLTTAHMSKGLEADNVFINDDFHAIINSYGKGKRVEDTELKLLYVAITRARKKLILSEALGAAMNSNLAFSINVYKPAPCLLDNLIPLKLKSRLRLQTGTHEQIKIELLQLLETSQEEKLCLIFDNTTAFTNQGTEDALDAVTLTPQQALGNPFDHSLPQPKEHTSELVALFTQALALNKKQQTILKHCFVSALQQHEKTGTFNHVVSAFQTHKRGLDSLSFALTEITDYGLFSEESNAPNQVQHNESPTVTINLSALPLSLQNLTVIAIMALFTRRLESKRLNTQSTENVVIVDTGDRFLSIQPQLNAMLSANASLKLRYMIASITPENIDVQQRLKQCTPLIQENAVVLHLSKKDSPCSNLNVL
ncbi:3'-5' exonuclease [Vibrio scophthalmi]|uniref:3'-5' exonuclease n=1 Tax=Vibrio scophthalmi TaxID=45658 RepID=UPI000ACBA70C|nr:3'-5' exonuclease [Vibrio scophthalmi]